MIAFSRHRISDSTRTFQLSSATAPCASPISLSLSRPFAVPEQLARSRFGGGSPVTCCVARNLACRKNHYSVYLSLLIASVLALSFVFWTGLRHSVRVEVRAAYYFVSVAGFTSCGPLAAAYAVRPQQAQSTAR